MQIVVLEGERESKLLQNTTFYWLLGWLTLILIQGNVIWELCSGSTITWLDYIRKWKLISKRSGSTHDLFQFQNAGSRVFGVFFGLYSERLQYFGGSETGQKFRLGTKRFMQAKKEIWMTLIYGCLRSKMPLKWPKTYRKF